MAKEVPGLEGGALPRNQVEGGDLVEIRRPSRRGDVVGANNVPLQVSAHYLIGNELHSELCY